MQLQLKIKKKKSLPKIDPVFWPKLGEDQRIRKKKRLDLKLNQYSGQNRASPKKIKRYFLPKSGQKLKVNGFSKFADAKSGGKGGRGYFFC